MCRPRTSQLSLTRSAWACAGRAQLRRGILRHRLVPAVLVRPGVGSCSRGGRAGPPLLLPIILAGGRERAYSRTETPTPGLGVAGLSPRLMNQLIVQEQQMQMAQAMEMRGHGAF